MTNLILDVSGADLAEAVAGTALEEMKAVSEDTDANVQAEYTEIMARHLQRSNILPDFSINIDGEKFTVIAHTDEAHTALLPLEVDPRVESVVKI